LHVVSETHPFSPFATRASPRKRFHFFRRRRKSRATGKSAGCTCRHAFFRQAIARIRGVGCVRFFSKVHAGESSRERTCPTTVCHRPASKMQCQIFGTLLCDIYITGLFNVIHVLRPLFIASMWTNVPTVVECIRHQSRLEPIGDRDDAATLVI